MSKSESRVGLGLDVHRLVSGRPLVLGGVTVPHSEGLLGHSDADVLTHAICDALLGAAGLGDIGTHFPDTDEAYRGISSLVLLGRVLEMIESAGWRPVNVDVTVTAQRPKLTPHFPQMRDRLSEALGVDPEQVGLKATTSEGLGAFGREEGIAALAVALIETERPSP